MKAIYVVYNTREMVGLFKRGLLNTSCRNKFLAFTDISEQLQRLIRDYNMDLICPARPSSEQRERFLAEYITLIGSLSKENNSRLWWATDIASKNRFTSTLPSLIHQFITILYMLRQDDIDNLVIFSPSYLILQSLNKAISFYGVKCEFISRDFVNNFRIVFARIKKILGLFYHAGVIYIRSVYARLRLGRIIHKRLVTDKPYYIVKSFIYNHSFGENNSYYDIFFGRLVDFLNARDDVIILANILGGYRHCIHKIRNSTYFIIPIDCFISFFDILTAVKQILFFKIKLPKDILFYGKDVFDIINNELKRTFNGVQLYQLLHYCAVKRLFACVQAKTFLYTYENNPWERMCVSSVKESSSATDIIGFQHTVVPQASLNMFPDSRERELSPMPDRIFTVGEIPKQIMERYGSYHKGMIKVACALRHEYLFKINLSLSRKKEGKILVALEGVPAAGAMVKYVISQLAGKDSYEVMIRTHPVLGWEYFSRHYNINIDNISNFILSEKRSLKEDIKWADVVIYWGSTVVIESLSMGRPVIHYDIGSILSYDPLFECSYLKWSVTAYDDLDNVIKEIYSIEDKDFIYQQQKAKQYIRRYFYPVNDETLSLF